MRSAARISSKPAEYHDAQQAERERIGRQLQSELISAYADGAPWYLWVLARSRGEHVHDLHDPEGRPVACPSAGCTAVVGKPAARRAARLSAVQPHEESRPQMELVT